VLDAQRQLLAAQLAATQASRDRYIATATLFKALGGGWQAEDVEEVTSDQASVREATRETTS
jgi:outer membrane protein TolC